MKKKAPKKRTKTAIRARKYEKKLKQRAKAGEAKAKEILKHREEYHKGYRERRKRDQAEQRLSAAVQNDAPPTRQQTTEQSVEPQAMQVMEREEEPGRHHNPLFVTPGPDSGLVDAARPATRPTIANGLKSDRPLGRDLLGRDSSFTSAQDASMAGGRGKLLRKGLGGQLAKASTSTISACSHAEDNLEDLRAERDRVREQREALLQREIELEVQLLQRAGKGRAHV